VAIVHDYTRTTLMAADPNNRRTGAACGTLHGALQIIDETHVRVAPSEVNYLLAIYYSMAMDANDHPDGPPTMGDVVSKVQPSVPSSPLGAALERVGDRWSLLLVERLLDGPARFNDLLTGVPGIAPNILSERLRRLERERVVHAVPYSARPVRMEYALTADGLDLASALRLLADWGGRRPVDGQTSHEALRHDACGTPLEARWYCPTCERSIPDGETSEDRLI
jgi:DNA-binding HxlR family transcriptional regulator